MLQIIAFGLFILSLVAAVFSSSWALTAALCIFTSKQVLQSYSDFFITNSEIPNYVVGSIILLCALRMSITNRGLFQNFITPTMVACTALFSWSALSLFWTPSYLNGLEFVKGGVPYFLIFVFISPILLNNATFIRPYIINLLIMGSIIALLIQGSPNFVFYGGRLVVRFSEKLGSNPLAIGELGGVIVICGVLLQSKIKDIKIVVIRISAVIFGMLLSLQSGSRGQLIFALIIAVAFIPAARQIQNIVKFFVTFAISIVSIAILATVLSSTLDADLLDRWGSNAMEGGAIDRFLNYQEALIAFLKSPLALLIGLGFNAFSSITLARGGDYAHNIFIELITEAGLPALFLFIWILWIVYRDSRWLFTHFKDRPTERASIAILSALAVFYFLIANKQANLWGQCPMFMYFCMISRLKYIHMAVDDLVHLDLHDSDNSGE